MRGVPVDVQILRIQFGMQAGEHRTGVWQIQLGSSPAIRHDTTLLCRGVVRL